MTCVRGLTNTSFSESCGETCGEMFGEINRAVGFGPDAEGFLAFFVESDPLRIEGGGAVCFGVVPGLLVLDRWIAVVLDAPRGNGLYCEFRSA